MCALPLAAYLGSISENLRLRHIYSTGFTNCRHNIL